MQSFLSSVNTAIQKLCTHGDQIGAFKHEHPTCVRPLTILCLLAHYQRPAVQMHPHPSARFNVHLEIQGKCSLLPDKSWVLLAVGAGNASTCQIFKHFPTSALCHVNRPSECLAWNISKWCFTQYSKGFFVIYFYYVMHLLLLYLLTYNAQYYLCSYGTAIHIQCICLNVSCNE